jgi:Right handed beta helix region
MAVGRRELILGTLGMGLALAAGPRPARAEEGEIPQPFSTYGLVPGDGIDQTASLQEAADKAAESGTPFFLPPGNYMSGKLELKSGTQIQGVPGKSVLRCNGGGAVISIENASDIRLTGLTLEGEAKPIDGGALLIAESVKGLTLSDCRVIGSAEHGIVLRKVSGRITDCEIGGISGSGLFSEDAAGLEIAHNHVLVTNFKEGGRLTRNIFFRKDIDSRGIGIAVQVDSVVSGNVVEGSPGYGVMIGWGGYLRDVSVTDNLIRDAYIGIGVSTDPSAKTALITRNMISGAKDGAIRAMNGPTPVGSDLAMASAEVYRNLAIYSNDAR